MPAPKGGTKGCEHNAIFIGRTSVKRLLIFTAVRAEAKAVADAFGVRLPRATGPVTLRAPSYTMSIRALTTCSRRESSEAVPKRPTRSS